MRTAIISDIHGNLPALLEVLRDADGASCNQVICLGDLVDGGPNDTEVVREIMRRRIATVRGNHEDIASFPSDSPEQEFIDSLPHSISADNVVYVHITPRQHEIKISNQFEAFNVFEETL